MPKTDIIDGVKLISDRDMVVKAQKERNGGFESDTRAFLKKLEVRDTFLDIGSYTGFYALLAAKLGFRVVFAFEPNPHSFKRIQENVKVNKANIEVFNVALWNETDEKRISFPNGPLTSAANIIEKGGEIKVSCFPLDHFLETFQNVSCIKIDAERSEPQILQGGKELIARDRPFFLIEELGEDQAKEIAEILVPLEYTKEKLSQNMVAWIPRK